MTLDEFQRLLSNKPHKVEEFLQNPDCPIEFKEFYLDEDDDEFFLRKEDAFD